MYSNNKKGPDSRTVAKVQLDGGVHVVQEDTNTVHVKQVESSIVHVVQVDSTTAHVVQVCM